MRYRLDGERETSDADDPRPGAGSRRRGRGFEGLSSYGLRRREQQEGLAMHHSPMSSSQSDGFDCG